MYEKILQKLMKQRAAGSNVSDRSLEDLAKSLVSVINTDAILDVADLSGAITSLDGNINSHTSAAVKKLAEDKTAADKKASDEKAAADKKAAAEKAAEEAKKNGTVDVAAEIAAGIAAAMEPITAKLNAIQGEKATTTRAEIIAEKIKDAPLIFQNSTNLSFKNTTFESDEAFNTYATEVEKLAKEATQEGQEAGLKFSAPASEVQVSDKDEVSPEMAETIKKMTESKEEDKPF